MLLGAVGFPPKAISSAIMSESMPSSATERVTLPVVPPPASPSPAATPVMSPMPPPPLTTASHVIPALSYPK